MNTLSTFLLLISASLSVSFAQDALPQLPGAKEKPKPPAVAAPAQEEGGIETPLYEVILSEAEDSLQLRKYEDFAVVSTAVPLERFERAAGRRDGFMRLFRYIDGGNEEKQKIAMTAPVFMTENEDAKEGEGKMEMSFVVPREVVEAGIPEPLREDVKVENVAGGLIAVIDFQGDDPAKIDQAEKTLLAWVKEKEWQAEGEIFWGGYDAPYVPRAKRRYALFLRVSEPE